MTRINIDVPKGPSLVLNYDGKIELYALSDTINAVHATNQDHRINTAYLPSAPMKVTVTPNA